jgi:hypothetical protein
MLGGDLQELSVLRGLGDSGAQCFKGLRGSRA